MKIAFNLSLALLTSLFVTSSAFALTTKAKPVAFETKDGVILKADVYQADGKNDQPTVLLLHMLGHDRKDWAPLVDTLNGSFKVVAVDMRGHGESTKNKNGQSVDYNQFSDQDWAKLADDVKTIVDSLVQQNKNSKIYIVGASIGANAAAIASQQSANVKAAVLLSPGSSYHGLSPTKAVQSSNKSIFIIASNEDEYSAKSSKQMKDSNAKQIKLELLNGAGHGTDMLQDRNQLCQEIKIWLNSTNK